MWVIETLLFGVLGPVTSFSFFRERERERERFVLREEEYAIDWLHIFPFFLRQKKAFRCSHVDCLFLF